MNNHVHLKIRQIIAWSLYDFASSAYFSVIITFVFASYFTSQIAPDQATGTALWGYTLSASALMIAIISPVLGAMADHGGHHKQWLGVFTSISVAATALLWFAYPNTKAIMLTLTCIFISNVALEIGSVFYNAFLRQLAPQTHLGRVSGWAWGCGYLGGLFCLIIALVFFIQQSAGLWIPTLNSANVRSVALLVAAWLALFSLPFFLFVQPSEPKQLSMSTAIKKGWLELMHTLKKLPTQRNLLLFLIAHALYIDGLNTLFALGGIYAVGTFGFTIKDVLVFGIILNIMAGLGAALFAFCDDKIGSKHTILLTLGALTGLYTLLLTLHSPALFWLCAPFIGLFVGPVQAASRTFLSRMASANDVTRLYGLYNLSGKATSFLGPLIVGLVTATTGSQRLGMAMILPFFIVGGGVLCCLKKD